MTPSAPAKLSPRAKALWDGVLNEVELDSAGLTLLEESCRTIDIIDRLTGALSSKNQEWLRLSEEVELLANGAVEIHLVVNPITSALAQQRGLLKTLLAQLKLGNIKPKPDGPQEDDIFTRLEKEFS